MEGGGSGWFGVVEPVGGDHLHQFLRFILRTAGVDVGAQPFQQAAELPGFDLLLEIRDRLVDLFPQLHRNQVAQRIGGELA